MNVTQDLLQLLLNPFQSFWSRIALTLPAIVAALLLLLVGLILSRAFRTLADRVLATLRLDEYCSKIGINEILARIGFGKSPSYVLSFLIYWTVLLIFLMSAANVVQLDAVSKLLERFALFLPHVIAAILVAAGGLLLGNLLSEIVKNSMQANGIRGGSLLAKITNTAVVIFASLMALEQVGIGTTLLAASIQIILGAGALGTAIAFGLGGKEIAGEFLRDFFKKS